MESPHSIDFPIQNSSSSQTHSASRKVLVQNQKVARVLVQNRSLSEVFSQIQEVLCQNQSFEVPQRKNGAVVAAGITKQRGNYGEAVWIRDLARVFEGFLALQKLEEAKKLLFVILNGMSSSQQLKALWQNIEKPSIYESENGHMKVPRIRLDAESLLPVQLKTGQEHEWGHKQNDALALSYLCILKGLRRALISFEELERPHREYLLGLPIYFSELKYWQMKDAGAWEEWEALRSSSLGLVTKVFEELEEASTRTPQEQELKNLIQWALSDESSKCLPSDMTEKKKKLWQVASLKNLKERGYQQLKNQLPLGESLTESAPRGPDAALAHLFWFPLKDLEESHFRMIFKHLKEIERAAGILRYQNDIYMQALYYFQKKDQAERLPPDFFQTSSALTGDDLWKLYNPRNPKLSFEVFGQKTEPQWSIHDPILASARLWLYEKYERLEDWQEFLYHSYRSWGSITPSAKHFKPEEQSSNRDSGLSCLSADAGAVQSFQMPEAYIPFYLYDSDKRPTTAPIFVPSKNTPLYWSLSELAILHQRIEGLPSALMKHEIFRN